MCCAGLPLAPVQAQPQAQAQGNPAQANQLAQTNQQPQPPRQGPATPPALPPLPGPRTASGPGSAPAPLFAIVSADQQGFDGELGVYLATGHVRLRFNGWTLLADRVEVAERSRSFYATGQVRLFKGNQYLQASRMRYSNWEGTGELDDVYGVIDQDTLQRDMAINPQPGTAGRQPEPSTWAEDSSFACPQLIASPDRRAISVIPPGSTPLPTMAAPSSCPGAPTGPKPQRLLEALERVTFAPSTYGGAAAGSNQNPDPSLGVRQPVASQLGTATIAQRVSHVAYQQSWSAGIQLNLGGLIGYTAPTNNAGNGQLVAPRSPKAKGVVSKIRFQSSNLQIQRDTWMARQMAFTNDPFTPARSWTIARNVTAAFNPDGTTKIWARSGNIILDNRVSLPAVLSQTLGKEKASYVIGSDNQDRDGIFLGYNLKPIRIGSGGTLNLQPQLLIERAIRGQSSSFIAPGASLGSSTVTQSITAADAFGLIGKLNLPIGKLSLDSYLSLATFNPDHLASGTRNTTRLSMPVQLPGNNSATASLFGTYRERAYNGSLGLQNVIYAYGLNLEGSRTIQTQPSQPSQTNSFFQPIGISWKLESGNFQANLYDTSSLANLWRTTLKLSANSSFSIWKDKPLSTSDNPQIGLRYSPTAIIPGLALNFGVDAVGSGYSDGSSQNTLTFYGGPSLTLGHFDKPLFDYTRLSASIAGTFNNGLSPFGFDRAVDLRTASFSVAQQIYGPLVLEAGATYNIDPGSIYNGDVSYSYFEVKLQRRSYEFGVYYSPYDGIGGIRVKLNDFNFDGSGAPFMPTAANTPRGPADTPIRRNPS